MVAGIFFVVCEVLLISGIAKILFPSPTQSALSTVGLPSSLFFVRSLGLIEILSGVLGILLGGIYLPVIIGALFAFFTIFILFALRNGQVASCGCFGATESPPSLLHVFANLLFMVIALLAVGVDGLSHVLGAQPARGIPFIIAILLGALASYLILAYAPRVRGKRKLLEILDKSK